MPDPAIVRHVVSTVTRGGVTMAADEIAGRWRRRAAPPPLPESPLEAAGYGVPGLGGELVPLDELADPASAPEPLSELSELPPLDEVRLGDSIAASERPDAADAAPADLFAPVVGLEYEKRMLRTVLVAQRQLHVLLIGAPGTAKSLLLEELRRLPESRYLVGTNMTPAGLIDLVLADEGARILLIDELDKASREAQDSLLSVMTGRAARTLHGHHQERAVDVRVIAAANSVRPIIPALRSRLIELDLPEMSVGEREQVISGFLQRRQGVAPAEAEEIAAMVAPRSADVRDAEQIATVRAADPELASQLAARLGRTGTAPAPHQPRTRSGRRRPTVTATVDR